eukprot:GGOE01019362.1.p1 GENE.GGOE01019362.1~~GGOE01019362.1.p1  ORF type:complete len:494 (+),score=66.33 GGOE01019362.1:121-1482(+)
MPNCEHVCCRGCIEQWLKKSSTCPMCLQTITTADLHPLGLIARKVYEQLVLTCGCGATCKLSDFWSHEAECKGRSHPVVERVVSRQASPISMRSSRILQNSAAEDPFHATVTVSPLNEWQLDADGTSIWVVGGMEQRLANAAAALSLGKQPYIQSPARYTWAEGYHYIVRLYLVGDTKENAAFCSVFFRFVEGDHDDHLCWPYQDRATLSLLNSSISKSMNAKSCTPHQAEKYLGRPPKSAGTGWSRYCTPDALCGAIEGDAVRLRVKFMVQSDTPSQIPRSSRSPLPHAPPSPPVPRLAGLGERPTHRHSDSDLRVASPNPIHRSSPCAEEGASVARPNSLPFARPLAPPPHHGEPLSPMRASSASAAGVFLHRHASPAVQPMPPSARSPRLPSPIHMHTDMLKVPSQLPSFQNASPSHHPMTSVAGDVNFLAMSPRGASPFSSRKSHSPSR